MYGAGFGILPAAFALLSGYLLYPPQTCCHSQSGRGKGVLHKVLYSRIYGSRGTIQYMQQLFPIYSLLQISSLIFGIFYLTEGRSKTRKTVEWTSKDLLNALEEFVPIYETRPIKNNMFGMGFDHSFGLWFMARLLKPDLMIESGAFKGHSTWVLRQAMPNSRIISLSPRHPEKYLKKGPAYVDRNCTYLAGKDFVDFGSVDWGRLLRNHGISDPSKVLVFFDDHQSELKR
jgi:hypothetical protein